MVHFQTGWTDVCDRLLVRCEAAGNRPLATILRNAWLTRYDVFKEVNATSNANFTERQLLRFEAWSANDRAGSPSRDATK